MKPSVTCRATDGTSERKTTTAVRWFSVEPLICWLRLSGSHNGSPLLWQCVCSVCAACVCTSWSCVSVHQVFRQRVSGYVTAQSTMDAACSHWLQTCSAAWLHMQPVPSMQPSTKWKSESISVETNDNFSLAAKKLCITEFLSAKPACFLP